jgi:hypothetical protein
MSDWRVNHRMHVITSVRKSRLLEQGRRLGDLWLVEGGRVPLDAVLVDRPVGDTGEGRKAAVVVKGLH